MKEEPPMIIVTIARDNKKVVPLMKSGFTHSGVYDYLDNSLKAISAAQPYGVHMEVWTKQDGKQERTRMTYEELMIGA